MGGGGTATVGFLTVQVPPQGGTFQNNFHRSTDAHRRTPSALGFTGRLDGKFQQALDRRGTDIGTPNRR